MLWVETDGTVYWATPETAIPTHGDGANRNDNKYIDNSKTYHAGRRDQHDRRRIHRQISRTSRSRRQRSRCTAWLVLVRFLQERYGIPAEHIYAHNWIDYKDARYCEGCDLAQAARKLAYEPSSRSRDAR